MCSSLETHYIWHSMENTIFCCLERVKCCITNSLLIRCLMCTNKLVLRLTHISLTTRLCSFLQVWEMKKVTTVSAVQYMISSCEHRVHRIYFVFPMLTLQSMGFSAKSAEKNEQGNFGRYCWIVPLYIARRSVFLCFDSSCLGLITV